MDAAKSAFLDENARLIADDEHSDDEYRFILLGLSTHSGYLLSYIVTGKVTTSFVLSRHGRPIVLSAVNTPSTYCGETLRFFEICQNPYLRKPKKQLTIRLDEDTIDYFRSLAEESGIPYQSLINLYLRDCTSEKKKFHMNWSR